MPKFITESETGAKRRKGVEFLERNGRSGRITVPEIASRLNLGRQAVYAMLEQGVLPGLRIGRRWLVTKRAFEEWERTCGLKAGAGLTPPPEVMVH